jgi:hypothetical protein
VSQNLHHPCKIALNGALTNQLSIEQTYSTLPDFTSWDQTRRLKEDGAAINDWAKRFLWKTLYCKTKNMDSKLTDTSALMKKAAGQKCQEYQPEQGSCNIINQADENIKHAQRHDPYYGDYKDFLVQWLQLPVDPRATPQNQGQIGVIRYPE